MDEGGLDQSEDKEGSLDQSEDRDEEEDLELEAMLYSQIYYDQSEVGEIFCWK